MNSSYQFTPVTTTVSPQLNNLLITFRNWLDAIEVRNCKMAQLLCKIIPASCPFERDIQLFKQTILHIPPLCKLNPFYEQLVGLRFRALCFLADCGE